MVPKWCPIEGNRVNVYHSRRFSTVWIMSVYKGQTCKLMNLIGLKSNLQINAMESEQVCTNDKSPLTSLVFWSFKSGPSYLTHDLNGICDDPNRLLTYVANFCEIMEEFQDVLYL